MITKEIKDRMVQAVKEWPLDVPSVYMFYDDDGDTLYEDVTDDNKG